jgi:ribosome assembly protein RRB1
VHFLFDDTFIPLHLCIILGIWNTHYFVRSVDYLLASGSDSGAFSIWDLRTWPSTPQGTTPQTAATFKWHKEPITSIDWHSTESSMLAVSSADHQVTLWDLALEHDTEEEQKQEAAIQFGGVDVPPQLLFIHQGQKNVKEIHFHPQIPGVLVSTAFDGFNVFKTINS